MRTQIVAILGNVDSPFPPAGLIAWLDGLTASISPCRRKHRHLLEDQSLIHSGAILCCHRRRLPVHFRADQRATRTIRASDNRIPGWSWLTEERVRRIPHVASPPTSKTIRCLAGNLIFLAFFLAVQQFPAPLFGLPIETRHVAFPQRSSAFAFVGLDGAPNLWLVLWAATGVAAIGLICPSVSFALALNVALRSRHVSRMSPWRE